jgi:hypothetical protein
MYYVAQSHPHWRCPRVQLADMTPAVLRLPDGRGSRGTLKTVSLTGGLLDVSSTLDRGSRVKVMFLTPTGPVLGAAEMLKPVSRTQQPFRFLSLEQDAQRKLRAIVQSRLNLTSLNPASFNHAGVNHEDDWIEKYRAGLDAQTPRRRTRRMVVGAITLAALSLAGAAYYFHIPLLK